ncbi:MAG: hypothetical protein HY096_15875 [Nitrospinae bacterium]|nr:hypothetical protein [Nitrospinota bacterium]
MSSILIPKYWSIKKQEAWKKIKDSGLQKEDFDELWQHWRDMIGYSKQHLKSMTDLHIVKSRPYWQFSAVEDSRTCDFCKSIHHKIVRAKDFCSLGYFPPFKIGCRTTVLSLSDFNLEQDGLSLIANGLLSDFKWPDFEQNPFCKNYLSGYKAKTKV